MSGVDVVVTVVLIASGLGLWALYGWIKWRELQDNLPSVLARRSGDDR